MSLWRRIALFFSDQWVLSILACVVVLHIVMMVFYLNESRHNRQIVKNEAVIQKIINAIYLVEAMPINNRAKAVDAMADPDIKVSLTTKPMTKMTFKTVKYWDIEHALQKNNNNFALSINIGKDQWLNVKATIYIRYVFRQLFLIIAEILIFMTIYVAAWSVSRFTRPLKKFKLAAEQLGIDLHSQPVDIYGPPVVQEAAQAMNQMQDRIQDLIRDRTQMLAAISHDLRTPITRMQLRSHMLEDKATSDSFIADLEEMQLMINEVLAFSREDAKTEDKSTIDLVSFLSVICDEYSDLGFEVEFAALSNRLPIMGRPLSLKRAFTNLINNAKRYGNKVNVVIKKWGNDIVITITDDGPGIPESDIQHVFQPFYRAEKSRNRDTGGVGLGLAVTHDVVKVHGGIIELSNIKPHGLQVTISFPMQ